MPPSSGLTAAGRKAGMPVGLFVGDPAQIKEWHTRGISLFVYGSDQSLPHRSAHQMMAAAKP